MTAIASLVITVFAFWLAGKPPAAFAALGAPGWIAWIGLVVAGWAGALLALLVKATMTAIDRSLVPDLAMTPVAVEQVPDALRVVSDQLEAIGMTRVTPPLAVTMSNPGILYGFLTTAGDVASSAFVVQPPGGGTPVTSFDFVSVFEGDRGGLTTSPNPAGSVLPATPGSLRQVFPAGEPAALLQRHQESLAWLAAQGVRSRTIAATDFEALFRASLGRQRAAFLRARLRYTLTAVWRTLRKSTPHLGPVKDQPSTRPELARLAAR